MTKEELLEKFSEDFSKTRGALGELIDHNRTIDSTLVEDLLVGDFEKLEEHIEISKIISNGIKGFNELYRNAPIVLDSINKMPDEGDSKKDDGVSLADIMSSLGEDDKDDKDEKPEEESK